MPESYDTKINKLEYWKTQIQKWDESGLTQAAFCQQSGITLTTFVYWRCQLLKQGNEKTRFTPVKIVRDENRSEGDGKIRIKLLTGHVVYLPVEIGINSISRLIHSLGLPHD